MLTEIKIFKSRDSLITWSLSAAVIVVLLQTTSVEASKPKTLDVIPIGGSDEFYDRDYVPPPRYTPPKPKPPPARAPPPYIPPRAPPPRIGDSWGGRSDEYHRQRKWENLRRPSYEEVQRDEQNKPKFEDISHQTPNQDHKQITPQKTPHKVKDAVPLGEGGKSDVDDLGSPETQYVGQRRY